MATPKRVMGRDETGRESTRSRQDIEDMKERYARILSSDQVKTIFDLPVAPAGMEYMWGRATVRSQPDEGRIPVLMRNFWEPVPFSRHADIYGEHMRRTGTSPDDPTVVMGLQLMERPVALGDMQRAELQKNVAMHERRADDNILYRGEEGISHRSFRNERKMMGTAMAPTSSSALTQESATDW